MTDTVKVLSDDEVAEIATRPWAYPYLHNTEQRVLLRVAERDALCATVRALRAENKKLKDRLAEQRTQNRHLWEANKEIVSTNTALREQLAQREQEWKAFENLGKRVETDLRAELAQVAQDRAVSGRRVAVLHSIGISGIGGSINDFWERLNKVSGDKRAAFCQALHQLCEIMGHNNENRCYLCEKMGARNEQGYYMGDRFFDGTKKDYRH